jgi:hypothetical protein
VEQQSWRDLEASIPLEELPSFHRAFLTLCGVESSDMPLRRVQQNVDRELNKLVLAGHAERSGNDIFIDLDALGGVRSLIQSKSSGL